MKLRQARKIVAHGSRRYRRSTWRRAAELLGIKINDAANAAKGGA